MSRFRNLRLSLPNPKLFFSLLSQTIANRAHGKRKGFRPAAAARLSKSARAHTDGRFVDQMSFPAKYLSSPEPVAKHPKQCILGPKFQIEPKN